MASAIMACRAVRLDRRADAGADRRQQAPLSAGEHARGRDRASDARHLTLDGQDHGAAPVILVPVLVDFFIG